MAVKRRYWLVKSEPEAYSWDDFVREKRGMWDGVRNYGARNNLRAMKKNDIVLFYHSVTGKEIVGIARVIKEAYPDPTAQEGDWSAVDLKPVKKLRRPVTLAEVKGDSKLSKMVLANRSRLSVQPVEPKELERVLTLGETKL